MRTDEIRDAALTLVTRERAQLAHDLLRRLDEPADQDVDSSWITQIEQRARELADRSVQPMDWEVACKRGSRLLERRR